MPGRVKGRIFAFHNPETKQLEVITDNRGASPGELTHNIFPTKKQAETSNVHDDMNYGHGNPIPNGTDAKPGTVVQKFPIGGNYNGHIIKVGSWHRVGVRNRAWQIFQIPQPGEVVEIPFEKMRDNARYGGGWDPAPSSDDMSVGARGPLARVFEVLNNGPIRSVVGNVEIKPVPYDNDPKRLRGWEVWFNNTAPAPATRGRTTGFIGTVVLTNNKGEGAKNAGLGLESMVCPDADYSVMQFVEAGGDYGLKQHGVRAKRGTRVRLGIRGHSSVDTTLPSLEDGPVNIDFKKFKAIAGEANSDWFDTAELLPKMGEKKGLVDLYREGRRINDDIPDTVYTGDDAFVRAEFKDPPRVLVEYSDDAEALPDGGWKITVTSRMPDEDELGEVGFTGRVQFFDGEKGYDDYAAQPPKVFSANDREQVWYVPADSTLAGASMKAGQEIRFDSGALGWRAVVKLPRKGRSVDTDKKPKQRWELCESNFKRAHLRPIERLTGAAATKAGALPAPQLQLEAVGDTKDTPGGGWVIGVASRLPEKVAKRRVQMSATPRLGHHGLDRAQLPKLTLEGPDDMASWFIPRDMQVGGYFARPGETVTVDTGALGWSATIELPEDGRVHIGDGDDAWEWAPERYDLEQLETPKT